MSEEFSLLEFITFTTLAIVIVCFVVAISTTIIPRLFDRWVSWTTRRNRRRRKIVLIDEFQPFHRSNSHKRRRPSSYKTVRSRYHSPTQISTDTQ